MCEIVFGRAGRIRLAVMLGLALSGIGVVHASAPKERIVCVSPPGEPWLGEKKIKEIFGVRDYVMVDFKVSRTNCYEFYAIRKNGDIVEAYYHPISGELVRRNELLSNGAVEAGKAFPKR
jgi:hypothetical protein